MLEDERKFICKRKWNMLAIREYQIEDGLRRYKNGIPEIRKERGRPTIGTPNLEKYVG